MFALSMPNLCTASALVESATKCRATASSAPIASMSQLPRRGRIGHRLERREGLRGDDEQRLARIEALGCLGEIGAVDIGDEAGLDIGVAVDAQRAVGHLRPEIRAADADIDDIADALAGVSLPGAGPDRVGEGRHPVEHGVHFGHDVLAVDEDRLIARGPQRHMQDGAVFADVDLLASEHRVAPGGDAARLAEIDQQADGLIGDAVLGIVEMEPDGLDGEPLAAPADRRRTAPADAGSSPLVMRLERFPFR